MTQVKNIRGMEKIFRGVLNYRHKWKDAMVQFQHVKENPSPSAIFMTCVDSRMLPTRFTQTNAGDMYISRNVGNIMPHSKHFDPSNPYPEPGFLELGVSVNNIRHVVICGHSNCKAMEVLHSLKNQVSDIKLSELRDAPIKAWLLKHALTSLEKYEELERADFRKPLTVRESGTMTGFPAYIDVDNNLSHTDKLSQVNTLMQMENIASYSFMEESILNGKAKVHAMWYDIFTGEIHYFSRKQKHFVPVIDANSVDILLSELKDSEVDKTEFVKTAKDVFQDTSHSKCCK